MRIVSSNPHDTLKMETLFPPFFKSEKSGSESFSDSAKVKQLVNVQGPLAASEGDEIRISICLIPKSMFSDAASCSIALEITTVQAKGHAGLCGHTHTHRK